MKRHTPHRSIGTRVVIPPHKNAKVYEEIYPTEEEEHKENKENKEVHEIAMEDVETGGSRPDIQHGGDQDDLLGR